jgi:hypothetical protein
MRWIVVVAVVLATAFPPLSGAQAQQLPSTPTSLRTRITGDLSFAHLWGLPLGMLRVEVFRRDPQLDSSLATFPVYCHGSAIRGSVLRRWFKYDARKLPEPYGTELRMLIPLYSEAWSVVEFWDPNWARENERLGCVIYQWQDFGAPDSAVTTRWRASAVGLRGAITRAHAPDLVKTDSIGPEGHGGRLELRDAEDNRLIMGSSADCRYSPCTYTLRLGCWWGPYAKAVESGR